MDILSLVARLTLDSSEYENSLNDAEHKAGSMGSKLGSALSTAAKVGTVAITAATTAVGAFAKSSIDAGSSFDTSMSQVAATMGKTMEEMETEIGETDTSFGHFSGTLREFAQYMGSNTAFSASQAADALNYMALAGYDAQTSMDMLPSVLNLAAAGGIELATASDMVTDAQSALGLSIEETNVMVDQMARASSKSNTSVAQLGEAFLTIGATARNVAGGTTELSTVLGVLADNGIKGAEGGTHLRNMLLSLQNPTDDAADMLSQLGIEIYDSEGNMRSMIDIMGDLSGSMDGMQQSAKDYITSTIFNKTDLAAVNALLGTSRERFDELTDSIENSKDAASEMAATQLDNLAGDVTLFKSALEGAQIAVSDALTPALREFVQFGTDGLSKLTTAFNEGGLTGAMDAFSEIVTDGLNMILEKLPEFVDAGLKLLDAIAQGILDNLPVIVDSAVKIVIQLVDGLIAALPQLITGAITLVIELVKHIPEIIAALIAAIPDIIAAIIEGFAPIVGDFGEVFSEAWGKIKEVFANVGGWFMDKFSDAKEKAHAAFSGIKDYMSQSWELTKQVYANVGGWFKEKFTTAKENIKTIWNAVKDHLKQSWENTKEVYSVVGGWFKERFENAKENTVNAWSDIRERMSEIWDRIRSAFNFSDAANWGRDMIDNFIGGIREKWEALKDTLSNVAQTVRDFIGFSEPKEGPLSNFHTYAPDMMELFAKGIKDNEKLITDQISSSFALPGTSGGNSFSGSPININVYGAEGQDVRELAEIVMDRITHITEQDRRAFA